MTPTSDRAEEEELDDISAGALVASNLRAIRARRGWTQVEVARRLGQATGRNFTQASISAMETGGTNGRQRRFSADQLYLLAEVFDVSVIYFLLPIADDPRAVERVRRLLGPDEDLVDERLRQLSGHAVDDPLALVGAADGIDGVASVRAEDYREWRHDRLRAIEKDLWTDLDRLAELLAGLAAALKTCGPDRFPNISKWPGFATTGTHSGPPQQERPRLR